MPYVIIENFNGGMDTRRMAASSAPGTLLELTNAHITRGGEIEKRKAFDSRYSLPAGTIGMAADKDGLVVFGDGVDPGVPGGVTYQRLQHPSGQSLTRILSWDLYAGKLYVAAEFANGDVYHFYDGVRVETWFDGKARGTFVVKKTGTETGSDSIANFFIYKDGEDLRSRLYMTNPDDPENPIDLTGGWVNAPPGDTGFNWANGLEAAIDAQTGTTSVAADVTLVGGVLLVLNSTDPELSLDGRDVWFVVEELSIFALYPTTTPAVGRCTGSSSCSNTFRLDAGVQGGASPYTYNWTIVDDGGASSVEFDDSTIETPELTVVSPTYNPSGGCNSLSVAVNVEVTDSSGTPVTIDKTFNVASLHCTPDSYTPPIDDGGSTIVFREE